MASLALSDNNSFLGGASPLTSPLNLDIEDESTLPEAIEEVSEPVTPEFSPSQPPSFSRESALSQMMRDSPPSSLDPLPPDTEQTPGHISQRSPGKSTFVDAGFVEPTEETALLNDHDSGCFSKSSHPRGDPESLQSTTQDGQSFALTGLRRLKETSRSCAYILSHPKTWSPKTVYREAVIHPLSLLPAVFLGLLLNILDALSYGMILFPLGEPLFQDLGSDGIAIFYVSTIVSQIIFSAGGSVFKGGIGSEMIEVVPFFHQMAFTILQKVGDDNPKAVLATTILSFALSSILTGTVFFLMGACRLGSLIGFFPVRYFPI